MNAYKDIFTDSHCLSKAQLLAYLNNTLDREEVYTIETHLNSCAFCSAALDGLMEQPQEETIKALSELKTAFQEKINPSNTSDSKTSSPLRVKSNRNRWMIAASVIALLGLASFSVYSFLHSGDDHIAMDTKDGKGSEYNDKPNQTGEIKQITVNPDDLKEQETSKKTEKNALEDKTALKEKKEEPKEKAITTSATQQEQDREETPVAQSPAVEEIKKEDLSKVAINEQEANNYTQYDTKVSEIEAVKPLSKKTKAGGLENRTLSNTKYPSTQNQNNLPLNNNNIYYNNNNNNDNNNVKQISGKESFDKVSDNLSEGKRFYSNKKYRKALNSLQDALKTANKQQTDEIRYYMALCYDAQGNYDKAEEQIKLISSDSKFSTSAKQLLDKLPAKK